MATICSARLLVRRSAELLAEFVYILKEIAPSSAAPDRRLMKYGGETHEERFSGRFEQMLVFWLETKANDFSSTPVDHS